MMPYRDAGGNSGISGYEIGDDFVRVQFRPGGIYIWSVKGVGRAHIDRMQMLAAAGDGLNTYINKWVHKAFDRREG